MVNDNLEQQVQAIFKSWFIDFEPFNNVIPNSWTTLPLEQLCTVVTKGTTPTTLGKSFVQNGINFIKAESIMDNHSIDSSKFAFIDDETNTLLKRSIIQNGDIVFTIAGTLGCPTAHCRRCEQHFIVGAFTSPTVRFGRQLQTFSGVAAHCRSLI